LEIKLLDESFNLHHFGSLFWPKHGLLIIADVHLGKIEHFRKHGTALPNLTNAWDYIRIEQNIAEFKPKEVVFLGDLFHSTLNKSWLIFEQWVTRQPVDFTLIMGNHDIIPLQQFRDLEFKVLEVLELDGFSFTHIPEDNENTFNICGHVHPGFKLRGKGKQYLGLSCFYQKQDQLILPAFGDFTGNYYVTPEKGEHIYVLSEQSVMQVV
jgi:DNA ligase-associated metallophosphoesterase